MTAKYIWPAASLLLLCACGGHHGPADGGRDALPVDAPGSDDAMSPDTSPPRACVDGDVEHVACGDCGSLERACVAGRWESGVCSSEGECTPGETRDSADACAPGAVRAERCTEACDWEGTSACLDECGGAARLTPVHLQDICIPAGPFIRGDDTITVATPVAEVYLSAYYIDRFPVTNWRYSRCVEAGACTPPTTENGAASLDDALRGRYPVQDITLVQAEAFCTWDGGRRLPTEAEWEKSGRGPAPRAQPYPWEGEGSACEFIDAAHCPVDGFYPRIPDDPLPDEVDAWPGTASFYGVELLVGGAREWVSDRYGRDYYADPSSLNDPEGPAIGVGTGRTLRGMPRNASFDDAFRLGVRHWVPTRSTISDPPSTVRCARSAGAM